MYQEHDTRDWRFTKKIKYWNCLETFCNSRKDRKCLSMIIIVLIAGSHVLSVVGAIYTFITIFRYRFALKLFAESSPELVEASFHMNFAFNMNIGLLSAVVLSFLSWIHRIYLFYKWEQTPTEEERQRNAN